MKFIQVMKQDRYKLWNNNGAVGLKMSDYSLILKNCNLVNEDSIDAVDIAIKGKELKELIIKPQQMQKFIDIKGNT